METQLVYDLNGNGKQLGLRVKERIVTDSNLQFKVTGFLNTVTGNLSFVGSLRKFFLSQPGRRSHSWADQQLAKRQTRIGAGVYYASTSENVSLGLSGRKYFNLGSNTWMLFKVQAVYDTNTQQVEGLGRAQLSKSIFNFTDTQDVRLLVGVDATVKQDGSITHAPYGQIRENNWSLNTDFKGKIGLRYDL